MSSIVDTRFQRTLSQIVYWTLENQENLELPMWVKVAIGESLWLVIILSAILNVYYYQQLV